jgi:hypothetical protein
MVLPPYVLADTTQSLPPNMFVCVCVCCVCWLQIFFACMCATLTLNLSRSAGKALIHSGSFGWFNQVGTHSAALLSGFRLWLNQPMPGLVSQSLWSVSPSS